MGKKSRIVQALVGLLLFTSCVEDLNNQSSSNGTQLLSETTAQSSKLKPESKTAETRTTTDFRIPIEVIAVGGGEVEDIEVEAVDRILNEGFRPNRDRSARKRFKIIKGRSTEGIASSQIHNTKYIRSTYGSDQNISLLLVKGFRYQTYSIGFTYGDPSSLPSDRISIAFLDRDALNDEVDGLGSLRLARGALLRQIGTLMGIPLVHTTNRRMANFYVRSSQAKPYQIINYNEMMG